LEKILINERQVGWGSPSGITDAYPILMNEMFKNAVDFIKSEEFNKARERSS
jgi:hypothetical protein